MDHEFERRKAPYAPVSALREFFERMRSASVPNRVDRRFLQKLNVASNNEWALLSALKFLRIVDEQGAPTEAYRALLSTEKFQPTLAGLVRAAYADLFAAGGAGMSAEDLENYFRVASSPSQAKNAARFFRELARLAGEETAVPAVSTPRTAAEVTTTAANGDSLRAAKLELLKKLPAPNPDWSPQDYQAIYDRFLLLLKHLES